MTAPTAGARSHASATLAMSRRAGPRRAERAQQPLEAPSRPVLVDDELVW